MSNSQSVKDHLLNCLGKAGIAVTGDQLERFAAEILKNKGLVRLSAVAEEPRAVHLFVDEKRNNRPLLAFLDSDAAVRQCVLANDAPRQHAPGGHASTYGVMEVMLSTRVREYNPHWNALRPCKTGEWYWRYID